MTFEVQKLIPRVLWNDRNCHALALAIQAGVNYMNEHIEDAKKRLSDTDSMTSERLNDLLWEMNMTADYDLSDDEKRALLKDAFLIGRASGTGTGLRPYLDIYLDDTWAGKDPYETGKSVPSSKLIVTDETVTADSFAQVTEKAGKYMPILQEYEAVQGQTIGMACATWTDMNGFACSKDTVVTDAMRKVVTDALKTVYLSTLCDMYLTIDGEQKQLSETYDASYADALVIRGHSTDYVGDEVTKFTLTDLDGNVIAEREMDSTPVVSNEYWLKVFTHFNSEPCADASLDLSTTGAQGILDKINTDSFVSGLKLKVNLTDGTAVTLTGCTVKSLISEGYYVAGYQFTLTGVSAGSSIRDMEMTDADGNLLIVAYPYCLSAGLVAVEDGTLTVYLGMRYNGDAIDLLGNFILGISQLH